MTRSLMFGSILWVGGNWILFCHAWLRLGVFLWLSLLLECCKSSVHTNLKWFFLVGQTLWWLHLWFFVCPLWDLSLDLVRLVFVPGGFTFHALCFGHGSCLNTCVVVCWHPVAGWCMLLLFLFLFAMTYSCPDCFSVSWHNICSFSWSVYNCLLVCMPLVPPFCISYFFSLNLEIFFSFDLFLL